MRTIIIQGSSLLGYSVLAAGALLYCKVTQKYVAYADVPARLIKGRAKDATLLARLIREVV